MAVHGPLVDFTRPEYSLCLQGFQGPSDPRCARALDLILQGRRNLQEHPRCDMPGFIPCEAHQEQQEFLAERRRANTCGRLADYSETAIDGTQ
jgi:hypothetical protein